MTGYINYAELENNQDPFLMTIQQIKKKTVQKMTKKLKKILNISLNKSCQSLVICYRWIEQLKKFEFSILQNLEKRD